MNARSPILAAAALAVAALLLAALTPIATAAHPAAQHVLSRGVPDRRTVKPAVLLAPHKNDRQLYGRIEAMRGDILIVRARNGRALHVDASEAVRGGTYSAPLFIGKLVLVTGDYDAARTLHAQTISRETRLDAKTGPDR